jgi:hypothetical protein
VNPRCVVPGRWFHRGDPLEGETEAGPMEGSPGGVFRRGSREVCRRGSRGVCLSGPQEGVPKWGSRVGSPLPLIPGSLGFGPLEGVPWKGPLEGFPG